MSDEGRFSGGVGYMDGDYMPVSEMRLPVTDMGFQLSDMCYDTIHARNGRFFRLQDHLDRFERSIAERRYDTFPADHGLLEEVTHGCAARMGAADANVTLVATRGSPASTHKDLRTCQNRFMAWAVPYHAVVEADEVETGCDIVIAETVRIPPEAVDPRVKNFGRLDFVRALFEAYDRDARYAVLLDRDGFVTEGRGWNIFALSDGVLLSPDSGVLEGLTRQTVMELSDRLNIDCRFAQISAEALRGADEVFLSSTAGGIMPVRSVDGAALGDGAPGPVTTRLKDLYWALHDDPAYSTPVRMELAQAS